MSGVTGVLLSYGPTSIGPFPGVDPAFTLINLDTVTASFSYGCATLTQPNISDWFWFVDESAVGGLYIEKFGPIGDPPSSVPDPDAVDAVESCTLCKLKDGELSCSFLPTDSANVPVGINFANYFADNPSATDVAFSVCAYLDGTGDPYDALGSYYTVTLTPYTGGVYQRDSYAGNDLTQVGGVSGSTVSYTRYWDPDVEYQIPVPPAQYDAAMYIWYIKATKTAYIWTASQFSTA